MIDAQKEDPTVADRYLPEKYKRRDTHFVSKWGQTMKLKASEDVATGEGENNSMLAAVVKAESS